MQFISSKENFDLNLIYFSKRIKLAFQNETF